MRAHRPVVLASFLLAALASPRSAHAGGMDIVPERLVIQPRGLPAGTTCQANAADPSLGLAAGLQPEQLICSPDNAAFRNLIGELGFAMAPSVLHPARTPGASGFVLTLESSFTKLNTGSVSTSSNGQETFTTNYWSQGTQGGRDPQTGAAPPSNAKPESVLQVWSLRGRKGLPFGFELGGSLGVVPSTSYALVGADIRWALLEGFRTGFMGWVPDIAAGGGVRTLGGSSKIYLTTASFDVTISKPITISKAARLTPHLGYQQLWIYGNSAIVDLSPNTDALEACGYQGADPQSGAPLCAKKLPTGRAATYDFANNATFDPVRLTRNRGFVGVTFEWELLHVAAQILSDLSSPKSGGNELVGGAQWTFSLEAGVGF